jgi:hypothetical protein
MLKHPHSPVAYEREEVPKAAFYPIHALSANGNAAPASLFENIFGFCAQAGTIVSQHSAPIMFGYTVHMRHLGRSGTPLRVSGL